MAKTQIADVIVPEIFIPYVIERTAELSALWASGIVSAVEPENMPFDLNRGGQTISMPFWVDLDGDDEVLSDSVPLTTDKIQASLDLAVIHFRGRAWSANELAHQVAGDDPMGAIANLVAAWWSRRMQATTLSTLKGIFASASMASNVHDVSALAGDAALITGDTFIDAAQKLGDAQSVLTAIAMHSMTRASLAKRDLIETIRDSEGRTVFENFMGKRVIVDDGMPQTGGVYTSYLFGAGALGYKEGGVLTPVETDRNSLAHDDILINRRAFVLHPRGVAWRGTPTGASPTNTEIGVGTSWERVYEAKNIRMAKFVHKIA